MWLLLLLFFSPSLYSLNCSWKQKRIPKDEGDSLSLSPSLEKKDEGEGINKCLVRFFFSPLVPSREHFYDFISFSLLSSSLFLPLSLPPSTLRNLYSQGFMQVERRRKKCVFERPGRWGEKEERKEKEGRTSEEAWDDAFSLSSLVLYLFRNLLRTKNSKDFSSSFSFFLPPSLSFFPPSFKVSRR